MRSDLPNCFFPDEILTSFLEPKWNRKSVCQLPARALLREFLERNSSFISDKRSKVCWQSWASLTNYQGGSSRLLLVLPNSPWLVKVAGCCQDRIYLYLLLLRSRRRGSFIHQQHSKKNKKNSSSFKFWRRRKCAVNLARADKAELSWVRHADTRSQGCRTASFKKTNGLTFWCYFFRVGSWRQSRLKVLFLRLLLQKKSARTKKIFLSLLRKLLCSSPNFIENNNDGHFGVKRPLNPFCHIMNSLNGFAISSEGRLKTQPFYSPFAGRMIITPSASNKGCQA